MFYTYRQKGLNNLVQMYTSTLIFLYTRIYKHKHTHTIYYILLLILTYSMHRESDRATITIIVC